MPRGKLDITQGIEYLSILDEQGQVEEDLAPDVAGVKISGEKMDLKEEVRRRIAELTRSAYERGYRDGAQSALAEIESVSAEDLAKQLKATPASIETLGKTSTPGERQLMAAQKPRTAAEGEGRHAQGRDRAAVHSGADCRQGRGAA